MDTQAILTAISSVGFPIVAYAGMFYLLDKRLNELSMAIHDLIAMLRKDDED